MISFLLVRKRYLFQKSFVRSDWTCLFFQQTRGYYSPNDGVLPRRESRRTLARVRQDLGSKSRRVLIPPFVSPGEIRILLGVDYKTALSLCGVKMFQQKYFWNDSQGNCFETDNKRRILVPFDMVAHSIRLFGLLPILADPEPNLLGKKAVPLVCVYGGEETFRVESIGDKTTVVYIGGRSTLEGRIIFHSDLVFVVDRDNWPFSHPRVVFDQDFSLDVLNKELRQYGDAYVDIKENVPYNDACVGSDVLVDFQKKPSCRCVILDVEKTVQEGTVALVLIQEGVLKIGQSFVAGTGFGKVTNIWNGDSRCDSASEGMLVRVGRIKGDGLMNPDDYLYVFPKERAWRLSFHRQRIELLNSFQTSGDTQVNLQEDKDTEEDTHTQVDSHTQVQTHTQTEASNTVKRLREVLKANGSIFVPPVSVHHTHAIHTERPNSHAKSLHGVENVYRDSPPPPTEGPHDAYPAHSDVSLSNTKIELRWSRRKEARIAYKMAEAAKAAEMKAEMHKIRQLVHHGEIPTPNAHTGEHTDKSGVSATDVDTEAPPAVCVDAKTPNGPASTRALCVDKPGLPVSLPVISLIVKTKSISQYESVLDELEAIEFEFDVKLPIVYGGIGPVCLNDVLHAQIEQRAAVGKIDFAIYTIGVDPLVGAAGEGVHVVKFKSVAQLGDEIRMRAIALKRSVEKRKYIGRLKQVAMRPIDAAIHTSEASV